MRTNLSSSFKLPRINAQAGGDDDHSLQSKLDEKVQAFNSVQRNYETMSRMMQLKQEELNQIRHQYESEAAKNASLGEQLQDALEKAANLEACQRRLDQMQESYASLHSAHNKLKQEAAAAASKAQATSERLNSMQRAAEEAEFKASTMKRERDAWSKQQDLHKAELGQAKAELEALQAELKTVCQDLHTTRDSLHAAQDATLQAERKATTLTTRLAERDEQVSSLQDQIRSLQDALHESRSANKAFEVALSVCHTQQAVADEAAHSLGRALELAADGKRIALSQVASMEAKLASAQAAAEANEQRITQLNNLLAEAEDKYQNSLLQGAAAGEDLTRLQVQIVSNRALLSGLRRQLAETEAASAVALQTAQDAATRAEAKVVELEGRIAQTRHAHSELLHTLMARVERALVNSAAMKARFSTRLTELSDRQQKGLSLLDFRLQVWEQQALDFGERAAQLGVLMKEALADLTAQQTKQVAGGEGDAAALLRLRETVTTLERMLATEQASKASLAQAKARAEDAHAEALASARRSGDERVEAERHRLGSRLAEVEAEVTRLEAACAQDRAAAARVLDLERQQMMRTISESVAREADLNKLLDEARQAVGLASKNQLATLHRQFMEETEATKTQYEAQISDLQASVNSLQTSMAAIRDGTHHVLADMGLVAGHLAKMGWTIQHMDLGWSSEMHSNPDPVGSLVVKAVGLLRLHFSYITEAVQDMARKPMKPATPQDHHPQDWPALAKDLKATVSKLIHVEESLAPNCTCMLCLDVLKQPTTCVPCGHTYCQACLLEHDNLCVECGDAPVELQINVQALEAICSKYDFKLSQLHTMNKAIQSAFADSVLQTAPSLGAR